MSERTEFSAFCSKCSCEACTLNCRYMPGNLIPADLERTISPGADAFAWSEKNLLASPGAIALDTRSGQTFRIPTLVPAVKPDGECIHLTADRKCDIHDVAPFGCAFFDYRSSAYDNLSHRGLIAIVDDINAGGLYSRIWRHLDAHGFRQQGPEVLRARMHEAMEKDAEAMGATQRKEGRQR